MAQIVKILPISEAKKTRGYTGTEYYSGYFSEEENPIWRDEQRVDIVNKMRTSDATVQAVLDAVKSPILSAEREIIAFSKDPKDVEVRDFVEKQLFNMPTRTFDDFLEEACTMFDFGHSVFEKIWGINEDGMVCLKDLAPRVQSSIRNWQMKDGSPGITQQVRSDFKWEPVDNDAVKTGEFEIPMDKLVVFTHRKEGDDYTGRSILRSAYKHFVMKDGAYRIAAVGIEKSSVGVPTGYLPEGAAVGSAEYDAFVEAMKNIRVNETQYVLNPHGYRWEFVTSNGGQLGTVVPSFIEHHDRRILLSVLAEFLDLGSGSSGSYALSEDQQSFFLQAVEHRAKYIASQITRQVIRALVDYNYKDLEGYPEFRFTSVGTIDFKEMSEVYMNLVNTGIVNMLDPAERKYARKTFKLPDLDQGAEKPPAIDSPNEDGEYPEPQPSTEGTPMEKSPQDKAEGDDSESNLAMLDEKKKTIFWRELTEPEKKVDFKFLERNFNDLEKKLRDGLADIFGQAIEMSKGKIERIIAQKNLSALPDISIIPKGKVQSLLKEVIIEAYEVGKKTSSEELDVDRPVTPLKDTQTLIFDASELANQIKTEMENKVKQVSKDSIVKDVAVAAAVSAVITAAAGLATLMTGNLSGFTIGENINRGRSMVFGANMSDISGFLRTEILDDRTCNMCLSLDSRIVKADDPMAKLGAVHNNCRGQWVALKTKDFEDQKQEIANGVVGIPKTVIDKFDTVGGVPVINSFTQLKKVNNKSNQEVQDVLKSREK